MPLALAINTLHLQGESPAKPRIIEPSAPGKPSIVELDDEQFVRMSGIGAVRVPTSEELVLAGYGENSASEAEAEALEAERVATEAKEAAEREQAEQEAAAQEEAQKANAEAIAAKAKAEGGEGSGDNGGEDANADGGEGGEDVDSIEGEDGETLTRGMEIPPNMKKANVILLGTKLEGVSAEAMAEATNHDARVELIAQARAAREAESGSDDLVG